MGMKTEDDLLALIDTFLAGGMSISDFWERFTFIYSDAEEREFSDTSAAYFSEVNDHLHYTDWTTPSDGFLTEPAQFTKWLARTRPAKR